MAELFMVRHGQASFGTENYDRLSPLGERQAEWLGEYFAQRGIVFDRVLAGSMQRQRQTAAAIVRGLGATIRCEEHTGLNEYDFQTLYYAAAEHHPELRALAKGSKAEYYRGFRQVLQLWTEDRIPGQIPESWARFQERVATVREDIRALGGQRVLAVSSGGIMATMAQQVLQAPASAAIMLNMQLRNTGICQYFFNSQSFHLASFNSLPHLDQPQRFDSISYA